MENGGEGDPVKSTQQDDWTSVLLLSGGCVHVSPHRCCMDMVGSTHAKLSEGGQASIDKLNLDLSKIQMGFRLAFNMATNSEVFAILLLGSCGKTSQLDDHNADFCEKDIAQIDRFPRATGLFWVSLGTPHL